MTFIGNAYTLVRTIRSISQLSDTVKESFPAASFHFRPTFDKALSVLSNKATAEAYYKRQIARYRSHVVH